MMMLINAWAAFRALPRAVQTAAWVLLAAFAAVLAFLLWLRAHDKAVIAKHEATIEAQADEILELAAKAAASAAAQERGRIEAGNDRAREAAAVSDDPWRDGLGALK